MGQTKTEPMKLMISIVDRGLGTKIVDLFRTDNLHLDYICLGYGTASSDMLDYLGIGTTEKDLVITPVPSRKAAKIIAAANDKFGFSKPGHGIIFTISLSGVSGRVPQAICKPEYMEGVAEIMNEKLAETIQYDLILSIINRGGTDAVMTAAKAAGAKGGTILHARRVGFEDAENFLGFAIQPEKEIVAILSPREEKHDIMKAINQEVGLSTPHHGLLLSLPVDEIMGL